MKDWFMEGGARYRAGAFLFSGLVTWEERFTSWRLEESLGWRISGSCEAVFC